MGHKFPDIQLSKNKPRHSNFKAPTEKTYQTLKMKFLFAIFVVACAIAAANADCDACVKVLSDVVAGTTAIGAVDHFKNLVCPLFEDHQAQCEGLADAHGVALVENLVATVTPVEVIFLEIVYHKQTNAMGNKVFSILC